MTAADRQAGQACLILAQWVFCRDYFDVTCKGFAFLYEAVYKYVLWISF